MYLIETINIIHLVKKNVTITNAHVNHVSYFMCLVKLL